MGRPFYAIVCRRGQGQQDFLVHTGVLTCGMSVRCQVVQCKEDGIVAMEDSRVSLDACTISDCKGPAVDLTGRAQLHARDCILSNCMGQCSSMCSHKQRLVGVLSPHPQTDRVSSYLA